MAKLRSDRAKTNGKVVVKFDDVWWEGGEGEDLTWSQLVALGPTWSQPCWPYGYIIYSKQIDHYGTQ